MLQLTKSRFQPQVLIVNMSPASNSDSEEDYIKSFVLESWASTRRLQLPCPYYIKDSKMYKSCASSYSSIKRLRLDLLCNDFLMLIVIEPICAKPTKRRSVRIWWKSYKTYGRHRQTSNLCWRFLKFYSLIKLYPHVSLAKSQGLIIAGSKLRDSRRKTFIRTTG